MPTAHIARPQARLITAAFDVHVPEHDSQIVDAWLEWCRDTKPTTVVVGGDFLDLESMSSHGGNPRPPTLDEDLGPGREVLQRIRDANQLARIVYLEGNHETRLQRWIANNAKNVNGSLAIPDLLGLKELDVEWVEYGQTHKEGKLHFVHGFWCNDLHAKKHLMEYGSSVMYGHTHRPQFYTRGLVDGTVHGAFGMPCMCKLNAPYLNNKPSGWMQGFGAAYVMPSGHFTPYTVLANHGQFVWNGKVYGEQAAKQKPKKPAPPPPQVKPETRPGTKYKREPPAAAFTQEDLRRLHNTLGALLGDKAA